MSNGSEYRNDEPHVNDNHGTAILVVRKDVAEALVGTDGDYTFLITDSDGQLWVNVGVSALPTGAATAVKQQPPVTTPTVYNVPLTNADEEYSQVLSANTREFRFRCRTLFDVRYAFVADKVATPTAPYLTLPGGSDYWSDNDNLAATTLYFATDEAGVVVEIEEWA